MHPRRSRVARGLALSIVACAWHAPAQTAPPTAAFPTEPTPAPSPPPPPPAAPAPAEPPAPPPPPSSAPATAPAPAPPPAPAATPATPAPAEPPIPAGPIVYEPPPPPPPAKSKIPDLSVRIDPFNLLLEGQLGLELEVAIIKYLSVELVPVFVVNDSPPTFGYVTGRDEHVTRSSNGWGPFAGTSIDVGIWPEGKALKGYVLRAIFTNYSYRYEAWDLEPQPFDRVDHVERKLFAYFGSHSRWGAFTLAGGFGIGAELNSERRCFVDNAQGYAEPTTNCAQKELLIKLTRERLPRNFLPVADLYGGLGGVQLLVRFSLGVVF